MKNNKLLNQDFELLLSFLLSFFKLLKDNNNNYYYFFKIKTLDSFIFLFCFPTLVYFFIGYEP